MIHNLHLIILVAALAVPIVGCGNDRRSASVSGAVTNGGQPVVDVIVRFQPIGSGDAKQLEAGMGSYGKTDSSGRFTMRFSDDDSKGAMIGDHTVTIDELTPPEEEDNDAGGLDQPPTSRIPQKWTAGTVQFSVKEGSNEANFDLGQ